MRLNIIYEEKIDEALEFVASKLPEKLKNDIFNFLKNHRYRAINEIRIHKGGHLCLIADSVNVLTDIYVNEDLINETLNSLCDGSVYAHFNTIKDGYISVGMGIRAGICGKANIENGEITGVYNISSINIRIPQKISNASCYLFEILKNNNFNKSVIIYSKPGVGKTTILRDLISKIGDIFPPIRFSVIDTKEEISPSLSEKTNADIYISYPKGMAIELSTKSMTPQIIICDEITSKEEAKSILEAVNAGVSLIATCHASTKEELLSKSSLLPLFEKGVFDYALGVTREYGKKKYEFDLNKLKWNLLAAR